MHNNVPFVRRPDREGGISTVRLNPCTCPKEFPVCVCGKVTDVVKVTGKPISFRRRRTDGESESTQCEASDHRKEEVRRQ